MANQKMQSFIFTLNFGPFTMLSTISLQDLCLKMKWAQLDFFPGNIYNLAFVDKKKIKFYKFLRSQSVTIILRFCSLFGLTPNKPIFYRNNFFKKLGFTPCKTEQPLQGMESQKKRKYYKKIKAYRKAV